MLQTAYLVPNLSKMLLLFFSAGTVALCIYLCTSSLASYFRTKTLTSQFPLYTFQDRPDSYEHYVKSTRELHYAGYEKFIKNGLPYRVRTSAGGERIILPMKYLAEIKNANQRDVSLPDEMEELLLMRYTGVPQRTDSGTKVVRVDLTRSLGM